MSKARILGISRSTRFSPNSVARDEAIYSSVISRLLRRNFEVSAVSEDMIVIDDELKEYDLIFSMARDRSVLQELASLEAQGVKIVNSPTKLLKMSRSEILSILIQNGVSVSTYKAGTPDALSQVSISQPVWLKRGDACAQSSLDVVYAETDKELNQALREFSERGVQNVVIENHVAGDLVKFYGVEGTDFFETYYATENCAFSKYGNEQVNGAPAHYEFDSKSLKDMADMAARLTGFTIYGGDAVVMPDGKVTIIDFNDWPSFSSCRKEASKAISERLTQEINCY